MLLICILYVYKVRTLVTYCKAVGLTAYMIL